MPITANRIIKPLEERYRDFSGIKRHHQSTASLSDLLQPLHDCLTNALPAELLRRSDVADLGSIGIWKMNSANPNQFS